MVDLAEIQTAYYMVATTGVLVAAVYYILNMRATLQTRQAQILMSLYQRWSDPEFQNAWLDIQSWEWSDYDDFQTKYGYSSNPDEYRKPMLLGSFFEGLGSIVKEGLIDMKYLADSILWNFLRIYWLKIATIADEARVRWELPTCWGETEELYNLIKKYREKHPWKPKTFTT